MLPGVCISLSVAVAVAKLRRRQPCPVCNAPSHAFCTGHACPLCSCTRGGKTIEAILFPIICAECTLQYFKNDDPTQEHIYTVSECDALQKCGCLLSDLTHLRHTTSLKSPKQSVMERRYVRSDVWYLRNLRRKGSIEGALGFKLKDVHPPIRHFLLGDYLSQLTESKTTMGDVLMYKNVIQRATLIVKSCPYAHPEAALDFCVRYPKAGARQFQELKEKIRAVFRLEGRRILHGLSRTERVMLKDGPLSDVYDAFHAIEPTILIRNYLSQWYSPPRVDMILADDGWKYCDWATGPEDTLALKLREFWESKLQRKAKLMRALTARGLYIPESCFDCDSYMNGISSLSLRETVAVVELMDRLMKLGFKEGDGAWCIGFDRLFRCLKRTKMGCSKSVNRAVRVAFQSVKRQE